MSAALSPRLRVVRLIHAQTHRYWRLRLLTQTLTLAILYAVPLLGLARFDLWDGRHRALFRPVGPIYGLAAVAAGIIAFYLLTFALNAVLGRVFCGFGCPIGQASRFGDDIEVAVRSQRGRRRAHLQAGGFALLLSSAIVLWFVSPRVLVEGRAAAVAVTLAADLGLAALVYAHGHAFRWSFCANYCPIGVYYSAVQSDHAFGIHFDRALDTCKDCDACRLVCPVGLNPRELAQPKNDLRGIAIDGFPERHHCLTCGDCVRACEHQFRKEGHSRVPLRLSFRRPSSIPPPQPPAHG